MGRDKALLTVGGAPLVVRAAKALRDAGAADVTVVGAHDPDRLEELGLGTVPDDHPGEGPLGGILTALRRSSCDVVVVLACDLPWVSARGVRAVVAALAPGADAAVPVTDGRLEPLHAAYRRSARAILEPLFAAGERSPTRALGHLAVGDVTLADPRWARSANRPADLPPW